ncbi:MAG: hypothetical protein MSJ26_01165, partial [Oscillospiraceae bacterium]|nr:hypothetical protein [Oscillospiraceae bacterium]
GTYTVKIDITAGTNYAAVTDLTADDWTFTITSGTLTAADFTFAAPTDLAYDGSAKTGTITAKSGITGIGTITVKYYNKSGSKLDSAPIVPGTYTVKIDVTAGTNYAAVTDLTADDWTFTITSGTLTAADFTFAAPTDHAYDGSAKTATITAKSGITGIGTITVKYYDAAGNKLDSAPIDLGTYTVKIDVTAGTNYAAATDLTADTWTFTITSGTLTASDFTFAAPTDLAYDGIAKTATVTSKDGITGIGTITVKYYDALNNELDSAPVVPGTYTVKIDITAGTNYAAVTDLTADEWTFTINRAATTVTAPTATAITYGQALSASTLSDTNWSWVDGTVIPDVQNNGYPAKITVDDSNYDYTDVEGYDSSTHTVTRTIAVSVNKATPTITVTATPVSDIAGKTVTVSAIAVNPNNSTLTDVPAPTLTYKVGDSGTETTFTGSFVIPEDTEDGTIITITAATAENGSYEAGANTATVTVTDCLHNDKTAAWEKDSTGHWHICNYCGAEVDKAAHSEDSGTVTTEPTETSEGIKTYKCTVCGYVTRTETIAVLDHTHVPSEEYSKDETGHWHTCSGCTEKLDLAAHTYGKWKITVPSTAQANGKKERSCTVCGYVQEGVVTYGGDESTGDMDNATKPENNACHADLELTDEEIINKIPLTPEELEDIENGADLEVYMVVIDYSGNVPSADKALAEAVLTDGMKIGMYIDVTLFVKVGDNDPRAVTNTNGGLKITFEMPEKLINTDTSVTREYSIIRVHSGEAEILACEYDKTTAKGSFVTDKFSTYSIAYKDITEEEPDPEPAPVVRYPIVVNGNVTVDKTTAAAGETVNVRTDFGYDIIVTAANGQRIAQITEKGSFTMPACKVSVTAVQNETFALMSTAWRQSYVYSYDSDMNKIKVNSTRKQGIITVNLGKEYAGKSFTIYEGKKSTKVKVTDGVLDAKGRFTFEVPDGKNYTLIVED